MSQGRAIDPLPLANFPTEEETQNPGFTDLVASILGDAGSDADGFDAFVLDTLSLIDSMDGALSNLGGADGGTLDDVFADIFTVTPDDAGLHVTELVTATDDIQGNVDNLGNILAAGVTSGGGTTQPTCTATLAWPDPGQQSYPFSQTIFITNNGSGTVTITSVTLNQAQDGPWTLSTGCSGQLPPGGYCGMVIQQQVSAPDGTTGNITVQIAESSTPYVLCLQVGGQSSGIASGGGGGGGGEPILNPPLDGGGGDGGGEPQPQTTQATTQTSGRVSAIGFKR